MSELKTGVSVGTVACSNRRSSGELVLDFATRAAAAATRTPFFDASRDATDANLAATSAASFPLIISFSANDGSSGKNFTRLPRLDFEFDLLLLEGSPTIMP
jgi:hypothetical protein